MQALDVLGWVQVGGWLGTAGVFHMNWYPYGLKGIVLVALNNG